MQKRLKRYKMKGDMRMRITLRAARTNKRMTQQGLAKAVGVTKKTVGAWESGKSMPKVDKIEIICSVLGVKYDDIQWKA